MQENQENKKVLDVQQVVWLSIIAALGTLLLGAIIAFFIQKNSYADFYDSYYKIRIKYPKSWTVKSDLAGTIVTFLSPKENELDSFSENLNISVQDIEPNMTLEKFSRIAAGQMEAVFERGLQVVKSEPFQFAGFTAYNYELHSTQEPMLDIRFVWFFKDSRAYVITYVTQSFQSKKYSGTFKEMMRSFSIGL